MTVDKCPYCSEEMIKAGLYVIYGLRAPRLILEDKRQIKIQKYGFLTTTLKMYIIVKNARYTSAMYYEWCNKKTNVFCFLV